MEAMREEINPEDLKIDTDGKTLFLIDTKKSKKLNEIPPLSFKKKVA